VSVVEHRSDHNGRVFARLTAEPDTADVKNFLFLFKSEHKNTLMN
jgi:hypothetical protein